MRVVAGGTACGSPDPPPPPLVPLPLAPLPPRSLPRLFVVLLLVPWLLPTAGARADDPVPGTWVIVSCKADANQKYACYLPTGYTRDKAWPILYCFAPDGRGSAFVERYKGVGEERGWIVVGSMNSRNGPWEPIDAALKALWADTEERFPLSKTRRYASGFSGGARVSFALADLHQEQVAGVIALGAGLPSPDKLPARDLAVALLCGTKDPNEREMAPLHEKLKSAGNPVVYRTFEGGHDFPPNEMLEDAVRWMDERSEEGRAARLALALRAAQALQAEAKPREAWIGLSEALAELFDVMAGRAEAEAFQKELEKDPAVKPEVKARDEYRKAFAWLEKNRSRAERFASPRGEARKKFQAVVDRFPDTRAAADARARIAELDALGGN